MNICKVCGRQVEQGGIIQNDPPYFFLCDSCGQQFYSCFSCEHGQHCGFQEDQSTPDVVMQTFQQGNMLVQQQVLNPDKIKIYCEEGGCPCWHAASSTCCRMRQGELRAHGCANYALATVYQQPSEQPQ